MDSCSSQGSAFYQAGRLELLPVRWIRSVFIEEKKLSIAALSQTLPDLLIEQMTPLSAIS